MKITALNAQNNYSLNNQSKPAFGMRFSEEALKAIKKEAECSIPWLNSESLKLLRQLQDKDDSLTLAKMSFGLDGPFKYFSLLVEDREGIKVHKYRKIIIGSHKKITELLTKQIKYLLEAKFKKPNAKELVKSARTRLERAKLEAKKAETKQMLDCIMNKHEEQKSQSGHESELITKVLPDFTTLLGKDPKDVNDLDEARKILNALIDDGTTDEQVLKETAQVLKLPTLEERIDALEDKAS